MRAPQITIIFLIIQLFTSCNQNQLENIDELVILNEYRRDTIWNTDTLLLNKAVINDTINFVYRLRADTTRYSFIKPNSNDSSIFMYNINCPLVATKTFKIKGEDHKVLKYFYDIEGCVDEETGFFYHKDYGLLVCFNDGWKHLIYSMEYDSISKILIDSIINDRTGFYSLRLSIPPDTSGAN